MSIPAGSIAPNDFVTPLIAQLAVVAQQLQGVGTVYTDAPDRALEDGSVLILLNEWEPEDDTNYKLKVNLVFEVLHVWRRTNLSYALNKAYAYVMPWFTALTAASNNELGGLAITVSLLGRRGTVKGFKWAGTDYIAVSNFVTVLTEFNINAE